MTATDRNDNTLKFSDSGVTGPGGTSIAFQRDARVESLPLLIRLVAQSAMTTRLPETWSASLTAKDMPRRLVTAKIECITGERYRPAWSNRIRNEYDPDGRLTRAFDVHGKPSVLDFDIEDGRELFTDRTGATYVRRYDAVGNVLEETDATGATVRYTYDERGNRLSATDQAGGITDTPTMQAETSLVKQISWTNATLSTQ